MKENEGSTWDNAKDEWAKARMGIRAPQGITPQMNGQRPGREKEN
jgi:hypothetical protein